MGRLLNPLWKRVSSSMYGLVNRAIEDLVVSSAGEETWHRIKENAGIQELQILDTSNYDDEVTYNLVRAASEVLEQPAEDILFSFGKHWVMYTGKKGWADLFAASGDDLVSFLRNLDDMHARVNSVMPDGRMPEFTLIEKDGAFLLEYRSEREGLAPMVSGILEGLAEQFNESWSIKHTSYRDQCGLDIFSLSRENVQSSADIKDAA